MKNKFLVLLLLGTISLMVAENTIKQIEENYKHAHLLNENDYRQKLYKWEEYNFEIFRLDDFPIDYSIEILKNHIKFLEEEMTKKKNGLRSNAMLDGILISTMSGLWGYFTYDSYIKMIQNVTIASYIKTLTNNNEVVYPKELGLTLASYIKMLEDSCNKKLEITMGGIIMLGATSALLASLAGIHFYAVVTHVKHVKQELEQDKRILAILEELKIARIV